MERTLLPFGVSDWLLAETTRLAELKSGQFELDDSATRAAARLDGADVTARIVERARRRDADGELQKAITDALNGLRWAFGLLLLFGLLAGAAAAQTVLAADGIIRLSWAILTLLGLPLLMLLIWLMVTLWPSQKLSDTSSQSSSGRGLPGRVFWWLSSLFARRFSAHPAKRHLAGSLSSYGRLHGARMASLATHAFWSCFFIGAIGFLWAAFLGLRFDFTWGTTLVGTERLQQLIIWIGQVPAWLTGQNLPSQTQIMALLSEQSSAADRRTWALYLISILAVYGLLPRLMLAAGYGWAQTRSKPKLDLSAAGYLQLLPVLAGSASKSLGVQGSAAPSLKALSQTAKTAVAGDGRAIMIGVELEQADWPPRLDDNQLGLISKRTISKHQYEPPQALGRADSRTSQNQLFEAISLLQPKPERIVALCSMVRTPDRGVGRWLSKLNQLAPVEIHLVEQDIFSRRGGNLDARIDDWRGLAERYGLSPPQSITLDETDRSGPKLRAQELDQHE